MIVHFCSRNHKTPIIEALQPITFVKIATIKHQSTIHIVEQ